MRSGDDDASSLRNNDDVLARNGREGCGDSGDKGRLREGKTREVRISTASAPNNHRMVTLEADDVFCLG